jgi:hypothetical protein
MELKLIKPTNNARSNWYWDFCHWTLVAQICNPSYSRVCDQKDLSSKPAWANRSGDPTSKIPNSKRAGGVAQVVECPPALKP